MQRLFIAFIFMIIASPTHALGALSSIFRGVDLVENESGQKSVEVELQCGEQLIGLLVRETQSAIGVAAVVSRSNIQCSLAPYRKQVSLNFLDSQRREIVSLPSDEGEYRLSLQEVDVAAAATGLQVSWDNNCKQYLGALFQPLSTGDISVAAAFRPASRGSKIQSICEMGRQKANFSAIRNHIGHFVSMRKPGKIEDLYATRVVNPDKIERLSSGQLRVTWQRSCNVVPLGLLFGGVQGSEVAVVTAYMPNAICNDRQSKIDVYVSPKGLIVNEDTDMSLISKDSVRQINKNAFNLNFESPAKSVVRPNSQAVLIYKRSSCRKSFGVVLGQDSDGNISVANLQSDLLNSRCSVSTGKLIRVEFPIETSRDLIAPKIYSLRIKGTMAR